MNTNENVGGEPGPDEVEDQVQDNGDDNDSDAGDGDDGDDGDDD